MTTSEGAKGCQDPGFDASVQRLGMAADLVADAVVVTPETNVVRAGGPSALQLHEFSVPDAEQFRALLSDLAGGTLAPHDVPPAPPAESVDPRSVRRAALAHVFTQSGDDSLLRTAGMLFPLTVGAIAARNLTVPSGQTFVLAGDGHNPVIATFGTVTLGQGAQISCEVPVHLIATRFVKE